MKGYHLVKNKNLLNNSGHKLSLSPKSSKNTFGQGYPGCSFVLTNLLKTFIRNMVPFSFLHVLLLFLFVGLGNVPSLIRHDARVENWFLLMVFMFIKFVLCASKFDVIFNRTLDTIISTLWCLARQRITYISGIIWFVAYVNRVRRHQSDAFNLISNWKIRNTEIYGRNRGSLNQMCSSMHLSWKC